MVQVRLRQSACTMHPKIDPTMVHTLDLLIMSNYLMPQRCSSSTTEPSGTLLLLLTFCFCYISSRSVQMRLYTLNKRHFFLVFVAFFVCFGLTILIGLAGKCKCVKKIKWNSSLLSFLKFGWGKLTLKVLVATSDAQWEGMGDVRSARYEPALLPPCPTIIRVLSYSN